VQSESKNISVAKVPENHMTLLLIDPYTWKRYDTPGILHAANKNLIIW